MEYVSGPRRIHGLDIVTRDANVAVLARVDRAPFGSHGQPGDSWPVRSQSSVKRDEKLPRVVVRSVQGLGIGGGQKRNVRDRQQLIDPCARVAAVEHDPAPALPYPTCRAHLNLDQTCIGEEKTATIERELLGLELLEAQRKIVLEALEYRPPTVLHDNDARRSRETLSKHDAAHVDVLLTQTVGNESSGIVVAHHAGERNVPPQTGQSDESRRDGTATCLEQISRLVLTVRLGERIEPDRNVANGDTDPQHVHVPPRNQVPIRFDCHLTGS